MMVFCLVSAAARARVAVGVLSASAALCAFLPATPSLAQTPDAAPVELPTIVIVTDARSPLSLARSGSAVTVIDAAEISHWGRRSVADALRGAPGLDVTESGGPGGVTALSLRGSTPGQTLILLDGVRIGDPSTPTGELDLSTLSLDAVERIEIVRGPQSALYGSDAMGGVVNIITKKGKREPLRTIRMEAGRYGTVSMSAAMAGATDTLSYAFSINGFHSDGFSRYGYRIGRITSTLTRPLEADKTDRAGASAQIAWRPTERFELAFALHHFASAGHYDSPGSFIPTIRDSLIDKARARKTIAQVRATYDDGVLKNALTLFAGQDNRFNRLAQGCYDASTFTFPDCNTIYQSRRYGVEYQGDLRLGAFGLLIFGARAERETASGSEQWLTTPIGAPTTTFDAGQTTRSAFLLHQVRLGERLDLSLGGRVDQIDAARHFLTWRATLAYHLRETGTKLRVAAGTGAKAASLFQRFSIWGTPNLAPEQNRGVEAGLDQSLFNDRVTFSLTAFDVRYNNLIDFDFFGNGGIGAYINIGHARMRGGEATATFVVLPDMLRLRASYTRLIATNTDTGQALLRRPNNKGALSAIYSGIPKVEIEGRVTLVGERIDVSNDTYARVRMAPYARLDARIAYKLNDQWSMFVRGENLTNARYQEIRDYGVAGRALYAGAQVTW